LIEGLGDTGVSLSLAKALVEAQGGQIWLESEQGTGTTFFVLLPLEPISQGEQS
jgi:two-component system sensor histidine kinase VicK